MPSKSRDLTKIMHGGHILRRDEKGQVISDQFTGDFPCYGAQYTESVGHRRNPKNGNYEEGGPFLSVKVEYDVPSVSGRCTSGTLGKPGFTELAGQFYILPPGSPSNKSLQKPTSVPRSSDSALDKMGATMIAQVAPTNSTSELSTALGEILKERRLPSIPGVTTWKKRAEIVRAAGSEYLNYQFGWKPLVKDVKDLGSSARFARTIAQHHAEGAGKSNRREFHFPIEKSSTLDIVEPEALPRCGGGMMAPEGTAGVRVVSTESETRRWFVGAFTYPSPDQIDSWKRMIGHGTEADKLFGIALDPDVLWELAPWSWAVDWVSNTGDVIHNLSEMALNGLVMRYGYVMEETKTITTARIIESRLKPAFLNSVPASRRIATSKCRRPANPFGFGLTWEGLSPTQLAIAAACGITHIRL